MSSTPQKGDFCLSIRQPFAWLVAAGIKEIENRSRPTQYRGRLWIHASGSFAQGCRSWRDLIAENVPAGADPDGPLSLTEPMALELPRFSTLPRGAIVGSVELIDCRPLAKLGKGDRGSIWAQGPFCYLLEDAEELVAPVVCHGKLGLWRF